MKCPACDTELNRATYENSPVFQCSRCSGYLMQKGRIRAIKSSRDQSTEALEQEVAQEQSPDSVDSLRCPKCLARKMTKERVRIKSDDDESFSIDTCRHCNVAWFDGGELARLQLDYETCDEALDEVDFRERAASRTAEEKEAFEQRLDALPRRRSFFDRAIGELKWYTLAVLLLAIIGVAILFRALGVW